MKVIRISQIIQCLYHESCDFLSAVTKVAVAESGAVAYGAVSSKRGHSICLLLGNTILDTGRGVSIQLVYVGTIGDVGGSSAVEFHCGVLI